MWSRDAGPFWRGGSYRPRHEHAGKGTGRGLRWVHLRSSRAHRIVAAAFAALPVLKLVATGDRDRVDPGVEIGRSGGSAALNAAREYRILSVGTDQARLHTRPARRGTHWRPWSGPVSCAASDYPRDAGRGLARDSNGRSVAR